MFFKKNAKDPVCGMEVKVTDSTLQYGFRGTDYFFCSDACLKEFSTEPQKYVADSEDCCSKDGHSHHSGSDHGHHHHGDCHSHSHGHKSGGCCHSENKHHHGS